MSAEIFAWLTVATGVYMLLFTLANIIYLKRVSRPAAPEGQPMVSVLIPARNESERIAGAISGLMNQDYPNFEVIVLDDNSEDGTLETVEKLSQGDERIRCVKGMPLQDGWKGKPFAMQQLIDVSVGEILLFIDADMTPEPSLVSWTVGQMERHQVDFLSGYAKHLAPERAEYTLFPVMYLATSFLLPLWLFRKTKTYMFSHAIGQYFCVRSAVMKKTNGFEPVRSKINEDIQMARYLKEKGYSQVFVDAKDRISGNMYDSVEHAKMGIMRVVYEYFDNHVYPFIFMGFVMAAFLLAPIPLAVAALIFRWSILTPLLIGIGLVFCAWWMTMLNRSMPWYTALLYPAHFGRAIALSIKSIILSKRGKGYKWKGRTVL